MKASDKMPTIQKGHAFIDAGTLNFVKVVLAFVAVWSVESMSAQPPFLILVLSSGEYHP
jgi:hypothetical protein